MLGMVFGERALRPTKWAGKTIQSIAACGCSPDEERAGCWWFAQLDKGGMGGADRPLHGAVGPLRFGSRAARLAAYREPAFFNIVNYEQVLGDAPDINEVLRPDVTILDEAQRIKNWQIKTLAIKSLRPLYAFVLTARQSYTASTSFIRSRSTLIPS